MLQFTEAQKKKTLIFLYKNYKKIDFNKLDQVSFFKTFSDLKFLDKENLLNKLADIFFEDLNKKFSTEIKTKIKNIHKTNDKIFFLLSSRFKIEKKYNGLIKIIFFQFIRENNSKKIINYVYAVADTIWKFANDRSVDFNYYTKRLILASVYSKILILIFCSTDLSQKKVDDQIVKSLQHIKLIPQLKMKINFIKEMKEIFNFFSMRKEGRGF
jgi:ubiquinone biosynthesis protein COQ9